MASPGRAARLRADAAGGPGQDPAMPLGQLFVLSGQNWGHPQKGIGFHRGRLLARPRKRGSLFFCKGTEQQGLGDNLRAPSGVRFFKGSPKGNYPFERRPPPYFETDRSGLTETAL